MVKYCENHLSIMLSAKLQKDRTREIRQGKALFFIFISLFPPVQNFLVLYVS